MHTRRVLRGRTLPLALGTPLLLGACADVPPTSSDLRVPPPGPDRVVGTAAGQVAERTIAAGGYYSLAIRPDGTVAAWGDPGVGDEDGPRPTGTQVPPGLSNVIALAAQGDHALALRSDGTMVGWGNNRQGQASPPALSGVIAISAGESHSLALRNDGTVVAWGSNGWGESSVPPWLSSVVAVEGGYGHSLALRSDGTVVAWGANGDGQTSVPSWLTGVVAIAAGYAHSVALRSDGTVVTWGNPWFRVPVGLSGVIAIAAGSGYTLALKSDGTAVAWGGGGYASVPAWLSDIVAIDAGSGHFLALRRDGVVAAWGYDGFGQTEVPWGLYARVPNSAPTAAGITAPAGMVSGHRYTFTVSASDLDGDVLTYAWDMNGDGTSEHTSTLGGIYYAFPVGGTHTVRVTITDPRGAQVQRTATISVEQNVAPVAVIQPISGANEGAVLYPRAVVTDANSVTDPLELKYVTYRWDFGDGTGSTDATPSKRYDDNGRYTVRLTVTDRGGASSTAQTLVEVANLPPRATLVAPTSASMLGLDVFVLRATSVTDLGPLDRPTLEVAFDCGEGYYPYTRDYAVGAGCVSPPRGTRFSVGVRVRDRDGAVTEYRRNYTAL